VRCTGKFDIFVNATTQYVNSLVTINRLH